MTVRELLETSLSNIGVLPAGESPTGDDIEFALTQLNIMLDEWNVRGHSLWGNLVEPITLIAGTDSYTIGSSTGTFNMPRPQVVIGCFLDNYGEVAQVDQKRMGSLRTNATSGVPAYFWYDADYPLGKVEFYPKPDAAYTGNLNYRALFGSINMDDITATWSFPPGYQSAITWCLSEWLMVPFGVQLNQMIIQRAANSSHFIRIKNAADRVRPVDFRSLNSLSTRNNRGSVGNSILTG